MFVGMWMTRELITVRSRGDARAHRRDDGAPQDPRACQW